MRLPFPVFSGTQVRKDEPVIVFLLNFSGVRKYETGPENFGQHLTKNRGSSFSFHIFLVVFIQNGLTSLWKVTINEMSDVY